MPDAAAPGATPASPLTHCRIVTLPRVTDHRGHLTFVEANRDVPFAIERVYYLYGVPADQVRGGHAYDRLEQVLIAVAGHFDVVLADGATEQRMRLDRPDAGLYVPPRAWRTLTNFSPDALCLVLASRHYDETDCERDFAAYQSRMNGRA